MYIFYLLDTAVSPTYIVNKMALALILIMGEDSIQVNKELYDESVIIGPKQRKSRLKCDRASALKSLASKVTSANQSQVLGGKL